MKKETEKTGAENRNMTTKIEELNLFNDTTDKELKKLRLKKQVTSLIAPLIHIVAFLYCNDPPQPQEMSRSTRNDNRL